MAAWELSIRHPERYRNVRIPSPFVTTSATMHYQEAVSVAPNASGNLLFLFSPGGYILGPGVLWAYYNGATLVDGTLGTITNGTANPFASGSGKPVAGFNKRVVSASLQVLSMAAPLNQTGLLTTTSFPNA